MLYILFYYLFFHNTDTDYASHFKFAYPIAYIVQGQHEAYQQVSTFGYLILRKTDILMYRMFDNIADYK